MGLRRLLRSIAAALALMSVAGNVCAQTKTPPNLTAATTIASNDLLLVWPTASGGPLKNVQFSVLESLLTSALGSSYLQGANNLSDLSSVSVARSNLGLGGAAVLNVGVAAGTVAAGDDSRFTTNACATTGCTFTGPISGTSAGFSSTLSTNGLTGTTGSFSGTLSTSGLTGTSASFSSGVSVTGLNSTYGTFSGLVTANNGLNATTGTFSNTVSVTGQIAASALDIDPGFYLSLESSNPQINFTTSGNFLSYNRSSNVFAVNIGGVQPFYVGSGGVTAVAYATAGYVGVSCAAGTVNIGTLTILNGIVTHC